MQDYTKFRDPDFLEILVPRVMIWKVLVKKR
jgi:hypothetical protein